MTMTTTHVIDRAQNGSVNEHDDAVDPAAKPTRRRFSNDFKDRFLDEYDAAEGEARGALLRREGLYSSHVSEWRNQRARRNQPATTAKDRRRRSAEQAELDRLRKKTAKLESELERTKLALEITGKAHALLELLSESADIDPKYKQ